SSVALLALGYPLTWGHLFLPGHVAEQIYALAPFIVSPIATYAYLRTIGRSRLASVFGGLSFGYGGMMCGILANSGMLTNSLAWAPLVLVFIEKARTQSFTRCLFWATIAYALCVLAGHGQSYVYVGVLVIAYGLFTSLTLRHAGSTAAWRPLLVALSSIALSAAVAAFSLLETLRVAKRSVRSTLAYGIFSEGSFKLSQALLSAGAQLYHYVDSGTYVTPLAFVLAAVAILGAFSRRDGDPRIWFWLAVALVAWLLLLGSNTPLNRLVYLIPVLNKFRVPSRHTFEWTLAVSVLGAFGWDYVVTHFEQLSKKSTTVFAFASLLAATIVGALFWRAVVSHAIVQWPPEPDPMIFTRLPESSYWLWKLAFMVATGALAWFSFRIGSGKTRTSLLAATIGLACFVEANATVSCWWAGAFSLPAARFQVVSDTTRYLSQFSPALNRVYTRVGMYAEEFSSEPRLEAPNLTMLWGLQNVAGMEPLILERYSRALGNVGPDSVTPRPGSPTNDDLLGPRSQVLNLLNTTHVVTYSGSLELYDEQLSYHDGIGFTASEQPVTLSPADSITLRGKITNANQLALVTSLSNSVLEPDGAAVVRIRLFTDSGQTVDEFLRAGQDTAEWAHERPDVKQAIKHKLATVFDSRPGDATNSFAANRYFARLKLSNSLNVSRTEITNISSRSTMTVWKASLFDSTRQLSAPMTVDKWASNWTIAYERDGVEVRHNSRALPRAWLVAEAAAVDGEEASKRIRGETTQSFEPRRTALLEVKQNELPQLPGGELAAGSNARIVNYEPNRIRIETTSPTATVLVVSEIFYPGWQVTIDGQPARIMLTDYLLRGVALRAGDHQVEMRYRPPIAGAIISLAALLSLGLLGVNSWRRSKAGPPSQAQRGSQEQQHGKGA
ncbi:MAG TPA: YfhO family protein, partial [Pyrinomonadaceae bacterium]|nr:YfhO family protein [Pyrinomonadaceae bacterium]